MDPMDLLWSAYVTRLLMGSGKRESEFLAGLSVQQGTFNRWKNGKAVPDKAAVVAEFARQVGRNPLEAFVAAGMLDLDEAGRGLSAEDREFLADLRVVVDREGQVVVVDPFANVTQLHGHKHDLSGDEVNIDDLIGKPSAAHKPRRDVEGDEEPEQP